MRNYLAILKKDLKSLFVSPIAYVVMAVFFVVTGYFFTVIINFYAQPGAQRFGQADVASISMQSLLGVLSTLLLFLVPMITMATFSEERKRGTIELLFTSPITTTQLVLAKFSAVLFFLTVLLLPVLLDGFLVYAFAQPTPPLGPILVGVLGALLLGGAFLALGLFMSSLTENQIIAAVGSFCLFIILLLVDASAGNTSSLLNEILRYLSILSHYDDFTRGILDTQHVVFYLSFIFLGLFLTSLSLDSVKWRK